MVLATLEVYIFFITKFWLIIDSCKSFNQNMKLNIVKMFSFAH